MHSRKINVFLYSPLLQVIEYNPSQCLDWLAVQTPRNKLAHSWVLQNMENWVERFLLAHNYPRVRTCKWILIGEILSPVAVSCMLLCLPFLPFPVVLELLGFKILG